MPTNTYVALATQTLGTAATSVTFSSIPQGYTDLVVVIFGTLPAAGNYALRFNGDTGSNYSDTVVFGNGSTAGSNRRSSQTVGYIGGGSTVIGTNIAYIMNYSNATTFKTTLSRSSVTDQRAESRVVLWRNTAAITSVIVSADGQNMNTGSTFSLYGIAAEPFAAKATGGTIAYANGYWTHTFTSSGTFTPLQSLSCDYLVVAGGGGGGNGQQSANIGGGGGGGGFITNTNLALANGIGLTVTVGAGGAALTSGADSVFSLITATGGGGGGGGTGGTQAKNGGSGGGAFGAGTPGTIGTGTVGQGKDGGTGANSTNYGAGGGGGATAVGVNGAGNVGGNGGAGTANSYSGSSVTYAGGGGGGIGNYSGAGTAGTGGAGGGGNGGNIVTPLLPTAGTVNRGGGGGGGSSAAGGGQTGATGGSGIVIIRYAN